MIENLVTLSSSPDHFIPLRAPVSAHPRRGGVRRADPGRIPGGFPCRLRRFVRRRYRSSTGISSSSAMRTMIFCAMISGMQVKGKMCSTPSMPSRGASATWPTVDWPWPPTYCESHGRAASKTRRSRCTARPLSTHAIGTSRWWRARGQPTRAGATRAPSQRSTSRVADLLQHHPDLSGDAHAHRRGVFRLHRRGFLQKIALQPLDVAFNSCAPASRRR